MAGQRGSEVDTGRVQQRGGHCGGLVYRGRQTQDVYGRGAGFAAGYRAGAGVGYRGRAAEITAFTDRHSDARRTMPEIT